MKGKINLLEPFDLRPISLRTGESNWLYHDEFMQDKSHLLLCRRIDPESFHPKWFARSDSFETSDCQQTEKSEGFGRLNPNSRNRSFASIFFVIAFKGIWSAWLPKHSIFNDSLPRCRWAENYAEFAAGLSHFQPSTGRKTKSLRETESIEGSINASSASRTVKIYLLPLFLCARNRLRPIT
jgi:hypothetical protein